MQRGGEGERGRRTKLIRCKDKTPVSEVSGGSLVPNRKRVATSSEIGSIGLEKENLYFLGLPLAQILYPIKCGFFTVFEPTQFDKGLIFNLVICCSSRGSFVVLFLFAFCLLFGLFTMMDDVTRDYWRKVCGICGDGWGVFMCLCG